MEVKIERLISMLEELDEGKMDRLELWEAVQSLTQTGVALGNGWLKSYSMVAAKNLIKEDLINILRLQKSIILHYVRQTLSLQKKLIEAAERTLTEKLVV